MRVFLELCYLRLWFGAELMPWEKPRNTRAEVLELQGSSYVQETFMCPGRDLGGLTWRVGMSGFRAFRAVESLKFTCWF